MTVSHPPKQGKPFTWLGCTLPFAECQQYAPVFLAQSLRPEILLSSHDVMHATAAEIASVATLCRQCGGATCHAPFISLFWNERDTDMVERTMDVLLQSAKVAAAIGAVSAVLHPNWDPRVEPNHAKWLATSAAALRTVISRFVEAGVKPLIENVRESSPDQLLAILEVVAPETGVCIDPGHAAVVSPYPISDWFTAVGDKLGEIHLHNNDRRSDQHRSLAEGTAWEPAKELNQLIAIGRSFYPVLEPKDQPTALASLQALAGWGLYSPPTGITT